MADGFEIRVKVRVKYVAIFMLLLIASVAGLTYWFSVANEDMRKIITFGSSLFGAMIGISTVFYTAQSIRQSASEKQRSAAVAFMQRWNDPSFFEIKTKWRTLNEQTLHSTPADRAKLLDEDLERRTTAIEILNFFEEMGVAINTGAADEVLLQRFFKTLVLKYIEQHSYWIAQFRTERNAPRLWVEIERVAQNWKG